MTYIIMTDGCSLQKYGILFVYPSPIVPLYLGFNLAGSLNLKTRLISQRSINFSRTKKVKFHSTGTMRPTLRQQAMGFHGSPAVGVSLSKIQLYQPFFDCRNMDRKYNYPASA